MSATSRRRWFQFNLRGLLVVTTVVAIGSGLWVSKLHRQQQALNSLRTRTHPLNTWVRYRDVRYTSWLHQKWLTRLVGEGFFDEPVEIRLRFARARDDQPGDADVHALGQLPTLKRLSLHFTNAGDEGMPYLRALGNLEHLSLVDSRAGDRALANMSGLAKLEELDLTNTPVTDAGLRHLAGLVKLRTLNLSGTRLEGSALGDLRGLRSLQELRLSDTKFTDKGLESVGQFPVLESLWLDGTKVTGSGFAFIPYFPALKHLNLSGTALSDQQLRRLPVAPALRRLNLNDTAITDEGLTRLAQYQSLEALELRGTKITGKALRYMQTLPRLAYLNLCGTGIDDQDIEALNEICSLVSVSLLGTKVTEDGLNRLQLAGSVASEPVDQRTREHLNEATELDFFTQPLSDVVEYFKQRHDQEILFDARFYDPASKLLASPVTRNVRDISLLEALEETMAPLGLVMVYRNDVLLITTRPVRPALYVPELADGQEIGPRLNSVLSEKTRLDFSSQPFSDVLTYLSTRHDIPIRVDEGAFRQADRTSEVHLTWNIKGIPLRSALGLILEPLDMTCVVEGNALVIRPSMARQVSTAGGEFGSAKKADPETDARLIKAHNHPPSER